MEHQDIVDRLVLLKAVRDSVDKAYEDERKAYTAAELERTSLPKGDGSRFGEISGVLSNATDEVVTQEFVVNDQSALLADTSEDFAEYLVRTWLPKNMGRAAEDYFYEVGEILDGCDVETVVTPAQGRTFKYFKVVPNAAAKSIAGMLTTQIAGFLEDEPEE